MSPVSPIRGSSSPIGSFSEWFTDRKYTPQRAVSEKPSQCSLRAVTCTNDAPLPRCPLCSSSTTGSSCSRSTTSSPIRVNGKESYPWKHRSLDSNKKSTCSLNSARTSCWHTTAQCAGTRHASVQCGDTRHILTQFDDTRHTTAPCGDTRHTCGLPDTSSALKRPHCASTRRRLRVAARRCCVSQSCTDCREHKQGDAQVFSWSPHLILERVRCSLSLVLRGAKLGSNARVPPPWGHVEMETSKPSRPNEDVAVVRVGPSVPPMAGTSSSPSGLPSGDPDSRGPRSERRDGRILDAGSLRPEIKGPQTRECIYSPVMELNSKHLEHPRSWEWGDATQSCDRNSADAEFLPKKNTEKNSSISKERSSLQAIPTLLSSTNIPVFPLGNKASCVALRRLSRPWGNVGWSPAWTLLLPLLVLLWTSCLPNVAEACSSRSTPRPRPQNTTLRPNITFQTYACPPAYAAWYCLNGATCFTVKISESILYNCECADGYMGQRCEYKDLDGSYLPAGGKVLLETASIAGGAALIILLVFFGIFSVFVLKNKQRERELDGVPRINININNSWPGPLGSNTPVRYYEHHTITTSTPPHPIVPPKSPHHTQPHLPHHSVVLPSTPSFSSHSLVSVGGKTLPNGAGGGGGGGSGDASDGNDNWGPPDRVIKTVTTITDLASIYSGRKQAVHRVEVVQEIDEVKGNQVSLTAPLPCIAATPWGNSGSIAKPLWTAAPTSWPHLKGSPPLTLEHAAEVEQIFPSPDSKLCHSQKLVASHAGEDCGLPVVPASLGDDASSAVSPQCREDLVGPSPDTSCSSLLGHNCPVIPSTATPLFRPEVPLQSPIVCVHSNFNSTAGTNEDPKTNFSQKTLINQVHSPRYNPTSSSNFKPTSSHNFNSTSSPKFSSTCSPNFNSTASPMSAVNAGTVNEAYIPDNVV